ncbi:MAG: DUF5005 domain-containing protein [Porphyromonadaceae bacterium]|nr:DUF5005 domain-containing protein [Porphyromonadaceae bacterium]
MLNREPIKPHHKEADQMNLALKLIIRPIILLFLTTFIFTACGIKSNRGMNQSSPYQKGMFSSVYPLDIPDKGLDTTFAKILIPDQESITGGDGTYSIALPDGRSIFLMGDSYTGPVTHGSRSLSDHMFRNSYILYDKGHVTAMVDALGENTSAAVPPGVTNEHEKWYWPGHGFARENTLYIFQTLMVQGEPGMWGFRYKTTDILEYSLPDITLKSTKTIPFEGSPDVHFGMAVLDDRDYIYIYAQVDVDNGWNPVSEALVARTTIDQLYTDWEYYDGSSWSPRASDAARMEGLSTVPVSSQFTVFKLKDTYVLLTQSKKFNSGEIYTFIADHPQGPWYNKRLIHKIEGQEDPKLFTYNATAHPQFEKDGKILISYNVNHEDFVKQHADVSTYRPRFLWIDTTKIVDRQTGVDP